MDVQKYIQSGVLEEYCLGLLNEEDQAYLIQMAMLYPEVKAELTAVELTLENMAAACAVEPHPSIKQNILKSLGFATEVSPLNINLLPVVNEHTDHQIWLNTLADLIPDEPSEDFSSRTLRKDQHIEQMLVITKIDVPEEAHGDFMESFFILKGRCECIIGNRLYTLGEGDFIQIPKHTPHNIKLVSPHVVAVLQHEYV
ncbi:hypothetical protein BH09BAC6_BH09BAC6_36630 [soil metagenome]|jgi:mannose-6-phosphate isomerase-like protein (cupin superfamily)